MLQSGDISSTVNHVQQAHSYGQRPTEPHGMWCKHPFLCLHACVCWVSVCIALDRVQALPRAFVPSTCSGIIPMHTRQLYQLANPQREYLGTWCYKPSARVKRPIMTVSLNSEKVWRSLDHDHATYCANRITDRVPPTSSRVRIFCQKH